MKRAFTTREKIMLLVLAILLIAIGYYKFVLEPINDSITQYQLDTETEQSEILQNTAQLQKLDSMQTELDEINASGDAKPLPTYDNTDGMLTELNAILSKSDDYSLNFGTVAPLEETTYIMQRPVELTFNTGSYATARAILDELHNSNNINQISDLSMEIEDNGSVEVTLSISYFELTE
jgi:Tfp pilus assembly protein PilO